MPLPLVGKPYKGGKPKFQAAAGDNYGIGNRAKIGKIRAPTVGYIPLSKKKLAKPPKTLV